MNNMHKKMEIYMKILYNYLNIMILYKKDKYM